MKASTLAVVSALVLYGASLVAAGRPGDMNLPNKVDKESHQRFVETIHEDARIYVYHRFLSEDECDHLRDKAMPRLERSVVVNPVDHSAQVDPIRTSSGMFFTRAEDPVIEEVERRLAQWTLSPIHNGEGLQVLRYQLGQKYLAHMDHLNEPWANGGDRYKTVLMYLEAAQDGGETVFPNLPPPHGVNANFSDCAKYHLAVKPKKGDAILFHSMTPGGQVEHRSMHGACPVLQGEKWSMTKWVREKHFNYGGDKYDIEKTELDHRQVLADKAHDEWITPEL